ncbi:MAG: acyloxyacyl hydrolase [Rickettsiales bacterium]|jgi:hypothetical protein|nr:acyloxyacyl hydrolase [Rickettsiales bacterium]
MQRSFLILLLTISANRALGANPIFGEAQNQISLHLGQGLGSGGAPFSIFKFDKKPNGFYLFSVQYSQPDTNFRLAGRRNLEFMILKGFGAEYKYSQSMFGASWDILLLWGERMYLGVSLGAYIKSKIDEWIDSRFTFGERMFVGCRFQRLNLEIFVRHFSNGDLTTINHGYDFVGTALALNY